MAVIAVNLREINLKREDIDAEVKIKNVTNNINLTNLKQVDFPLSDTGKALVFSFEYKSDYEMSEPKEGVLGTIYMAGDVLLIQLILKRFIFQGRFYCLALSNCLR